MVNHNMLTKSLRILEYIAEQNAGVSFSEICTHFSMPKSSTHSLVNTLCNLNYLVKNKENHFSIGFKAFEVGSKFIENTDIYTYSRNVLYTLVNKVDETAHLAFLDGSEIIYLNKCECSHALRMISSVGKRVPAHGTAVGKALLSEKTDAEMRQLYTGTLQKITENTVDNLDVLLHQLEEIRQSGFATEIEESTGGVCCIAVPVMDRSGKVALGMSIAIPKIRFDGSFERYKEPLLEAKKNIEQYFI
jgi:DNA-binding IclR family transcriptional regulator